MSVHLLKLEVTGGLTEQEETRCILQLESALNVIAKSLGGAARLQKASLSDCREHLRELGYYVT